MKKLVALVAILMLAFPIVPGSAIGTFEKDEGIALVSTLEEFSAGLDPLPKGSELSIQSILGGRAVTGTKKLENNGYSLYCLYADGEKIGWYVFSPDGKIEVYDELKHATALNSTMKIERKLNDLLNTMDDYDVVPVYVTYGDVDHTTITSKLSVQYPTLFESTTTAFDNKSTYREATVYQLETATSVKRKMYEEEYEKKSRQVLDNHLADSAKILYQGHYFPMSIIELCKADIVELSKNDDVVSILLYEPVTFVPAAYDAAKVIQADYVRDTLGITGQGVKVGIIEALGRVDATKAMVEGRITQRYPNDSISDHATQVATIIGADVVYGIAPKVSIYATCSKAGTTFFEEIEWLLSQGVSVINASMGFVAPDGTYSIYDQFIDHLAMQHDVHFVNSAGNYGNTTGFISSPGMAYNAITVGNFGYSRTVDHADDYMNSSSSWRESSSLLPNKPDLIAPGTTIRLPGFETPSGTSFSAPFTTGVIAQMIQISPGLATKQTAMKAILLASAYRKINASGYGLTGSPFLSDVEGAGKLDSKNARYIINSDRYASGTVEGTGIVYTKTFNVSSSSSQIRVALYWLKKNTITGSHNSSEVNITSLPLADLDLHVYDPNGNRVGSSNSINNNVEIVEFDPSVSGNYRIEIVSYSNSRESFGLAWW